MADDLRTNDVDRTIDNTTVNPGSVPDTNRDSNPDALTGAPGSHPIGTGIGAASIGAAGAAIGSVIPGVGTAIGGAIGAVVGAVAGGYAGKAVAEAVNPSVEDEYWRTHHTSRPYYEQGYNYENDYQPAYRYGWESRSQHAGRTFDEAHNDLESGWEQTKGKSRLGWDKAKQATRDAWHKVEGEFEDAKSSVASHMPGSARDDEYRSNPDKSQAADFATRNSPATGAISGATGSTTGMGTSNPPPLPGTSDAAGMSGAKSDPSHRDTGTTNVQTQRGSESSTI